MGYTGYGRLHIIDKEPVPSPFVLFLTPVRVRVRVRFA